MRIQQWRLLRLSLSSLHHSPSLKNPSLRFLSGTSFDPQTASSSIFAAIFKQNPLLPNTDIEENIKSCHVAVNHDLIVEALKGLGDSPDAARRVFGFVSETRGELLSSKSYNYVCGVLGSNGFVSEFWEFVSVMKNKGYGLKKGTYDRVFERFEKDGLVSDLDKLKKVYLSGSISSLSENSQENVCSKVSNVIKGNVWGDEVEKELGEMKGEFGSDLVSKVLGKLESDPNKGLIFFRWVEESGFFKHNEASYNTMALVLAREDFVDKFWKVVFEMRGAGFELRKENYVEVLGKFVKKRMVKEAVDLYEFAMCGANKPSVHDCTLLLRKIVTSKELDMDVFRKAVKSFTQGGNVLSNSILDAVVKSLTSVDRLEECNKVMKAMGEVGFSPSEGLQNKIAFTLGFKGKKEAAGEFLDYLETLGLDSSFKTWTSLIEGHCTSGDISEAFNSLHNMVEKTGSNGASNALDMVVNLYIRQNRAIDAYKLVKEMVNENEMEPWHSTYKVLITKLLVGGSFKESLELLGLMKNHGFPPFLEPFIEYVSKTGTADEAMTFLSATTVKKVPSANVFIRVFEAYLKTGKHSEAHNLLSICPRVIRDNADILNLFFAMKVETEPVLAA